jgi:hypothetical protein
MACLPGPLKTGEQACNVCLEVQNDEPHGSYLSFHKHGEEVCV